MNPPDSTQEPQWKPWQLTDFSAAGSQVAAESASAAENTAEPAAAAEAPAPTLPEGPVITVEAALAAAEHKEALETERTQARQQGYDTGFAEGRAAGEQEGQAAGYEKGYAQAQAQALRWQELTGQLAGALQDFDRQMATAVLDLALDVAQQVLRQSLHVHPELLLACIREALTQLPQAKAQISVHPDDAALVQKYLDELPGHPGHQVQENSRIHPGGCLIETRDSQVDARLQTRWQRIAESLGRDTRWLDHELSLDPMADSAILESEAALVADADSSDTRPEDLTQERSDSLSDAPLPSPLSAPRTSSAPADESAAPAAALTQPTDATDEPGATVMDAAGDAVMDTPDSP